MVNFFESSVIDCQYIFPTPIGNIILYMYSIQLSIFNETVIVYVYVFNAVIAVIVYHLGCFAEYKLGIEDTARVVPVHGVWYVSSIENLFI